MRLSKHARADLALILITFIWGSTFAIVKQSLEYVSPVLFVALRFWVAAAIAAVLLRSQIPQISGAALRRGLLLAGMLLGGFIFQTIGLRHTSPSDSAFITNLSVLLVPLLGFLIFRHRPRKQTVAGILLATLGLFFLLAQKAVVKMGSGEGLTLICAVMFAFQILFLGRFVSASDYRQLMVVQLAGTAAACTLITPVLETPFIVWNSTVALNLLVTGVLATAFALIVQAWAQRYTSANHVALILSLEPFFAALFAFWLLGQILTAKEWFGGMLILTGILVSELQIKPPNK